MSFFTELTYRFETAPFVYQRIILRYMLPWFRNVQLTDITCNRTAANTRDSPEEESVANTDVESPFPHVEMTGDGWGSNRATQLVLNNLFFLTIKVCRSIHLSYCSILSCKKPMYLYCTLRACRNKATIFLLAKHVCKFVLFKSHWESASERNRLVGW